MPTVEGAFTAEATLQSRSPEEASTEACIEFAEEEAPKGESVAGTEAVDAAISADHQRQLNCSSRQCAWKPAGME